MMVRHLCTLQVGPGRLVPASSLGAVGRGAMPFRGLYAKTNGVVRTDRGMA